MSRKSKILTAGRFHKLNLQRNLKKRNKLDTDQPKRDKLKDKENRQSVRVPEEQREETAYESGVEKKIKRRFRFMKDIRELSIPTTLFFSER